MKEISIAYNEDAKVWSNNKCKLYLSCIIGYPFSAYRTESTISTFIQIMASNNK
jgi:hypothetical protein